MRGGGGRGVICGFLLQVIIVFKTSVFVRPNANDKPSSLKNLHSGNRLRKPAFLVPENAVCVWTEG